MSKGIKILSEEVEIIFSEVHLPFKEDGSMDNFEADGVKFTSRSFSSCFPAKRFHAWQKWSLVAGFGKTFQEIWNNQNDLSKLLKEAIKDPTKILDAWQHVETFKKSVEDFNDKRTFACYMLASVFILREGEDTNNWDEEYQEQKIENWINAGISTPDFFQFALATIPQFADAYRSMQMSAAQ